jgi:hypothetical protein
MPVGSSSSRVFQIALIAIAACASTTLATSAAARPRLYLLAQSKTNRLPRAGRSVNVKQGATVRLYLAVRDRGRVFSDAPRSRRRNRHQARRYRPLSDLGRYRLRWFQVEPRPHHVDTQPPNAGNPAYSNATLFGRNHGKWLGFDTIEYHEVELSAFRQKGVLIIKRTHPSHARVNVNGGLGTMRYKAQLTLLDRLDPKTGQPLVLSTPGAERTTRQGISRQVFRVTFRSSNHFVGFLRGFFNVPNVFGSAGGTRFHQTELYQGADCADVIVGAMRAAGARVPYTSAAGLKRYARAVTPKLLLTKNGLFDPTTKTPVNVQFLAANGSRSHSRKHPRRRGLAVKSGDLMLIDYVGFNASPRSWDHVAVVDRDLGKKGRFDPRDPVLHMGYLYGLTEEAASGEAPAVVQFLRLSRSIRRAMARRARRLDQAR